MTRLMMTACVAILAAQGAAFAEGAALVIGNSVYRNAPKAVSAEADARAVADRLEAAGYDVTFGLDLTRVEMRAAMDEFSRDAEGEAQQVVFYSGHAMRMAGRTFLAPVDFDPRGPVAVAFDGAPFEALQSLTARAERAVIFIDGAQLDGFDATEFAEPGIAPISAEAGAAIVSAAAPGWAIRRSEDGQSRFGLAVVDAFLAPGATFEDAVAAAGDAIWTAGSVKGMQIIPAPEPKPVASAAAGANLQVELAFWRSTEAGGQPADYQAYLAAYPDGIFATIARNRLGDSAPAATAQPTDTPAVNPAEAEEAALSLSRAARLQIQRDLTTLGYDTRGVDGVFRRGTRGAIRGWQEAEGLAATGFVGAGQAERLRSNAAEVALRQEQEAAARAALSAEQARQQEAADWARTQQIGTVAAYERFITAYPDGTFTRDAQRVLDRSRAEADRVDWEEAKRLDTAGAYDRYLDLHPDGKFTEIAQRRLEARRGAEPDVDDRTAWRQAQSEDTAKAYRDFVRAYPNSRFAAEADRRAAELLHEGRARQEERLNLSARDWESIEKRLDFLRFRVGRIDGRPDDDLRRAIFEYRRSRGLVEHAYVSQDFIDTLLKETSGGGSAGQVLNQLFQQLQKN